jgi:hypothetical protein
MASRLSLLPALAAALLAAACDKTPEPDPIGPAARPTGAGTSKPAAPAKPETPLDVGYDAPAGWQKAENPSPMRKATYRIPAAPGDAEGAEMSVSQAGGSVNMNVERWVGQFQPKVGDAKRAEKKVGDLKITVIEIHGTFSAGSMGAPGAGGAPKEGWALLGAIVETRTPTFFKLTGPEKTVNAAKPDFDKLVESFRPK